MKAWMIEHKRTLIVVGLVVVGAIVGTAVVFAVTSNDNLKPVEEIPAEVPFEM